MSNQVTQQVLVEFIGQVSNTFNQAFKTLNDGLKGIAAQQTATNKVMAEGTKVAEKSAKENVKFAAQTDKVKDAKSRYSKTLKELTADYSKEAAGITSVLSAFKYYAAGVSKGNLTVDAARNSTKAYISALTNTNAVLMASDKAHVSWMKNVKLGTILRAQERGEIALTRNGIVMLTADAAKHLGMTQKQAEVIKQSALSQDYYSNKLREAKKIGGDYLKSFQTLGAAYQTTDAKAAVWIGSLEKSDKALLNLRERLKSTRVGSVQLADGLSRSSIVAGMMNESIKVAGNSFRIYNEAGLKTLGLTEDQAAKLGLLSRSYGAYGATLQKMHLSGDKNLSIFKDLAATYGRNEKSVKSINSALTQMNDTVEKKSLAKQRELNAAVAAGTLTQKQADKELRTYTSSIDRASIAKEAMVANQKKSIEADRMYNSEMSKSAAFSSQYQSVLASLRQEHGRGTDAYKAHALALTDVEKAINKQSKLMNKAGLDGNAWAAAQDRAALAQQRVNGQLEIANGVMSNQAHLIPDMGAKAQGLAGVLNNLGTSLMNVAKYAVGAFAFYGAMSTLTGITTQIMNYDQALKDLQAITTATDAQTAQFGQTIKDVSRVTKFGASEIADGMKNLGQAGFSASETINVIGDAAMLATGTLSDMATVVDLLTTTIRAYHLESTESARLTDLFANAINRSKLTVDKLRVAFNYLASVADKANVSVDDSVTLMGILANSGVRASTIGTSLRQVIEGLVSPNKAFKDAVAQAGYTIDQFVVNEANPLEDVIRRLQKVVPDAAAAFELFGIRGAPAISAITSNGVDGFMRMKESMQESGSAAKMAEIQMEGLANKAKNMKDRFELVSIALGEGGLKLILEGLVEVGRALATLLETFLNSAIGSVTVSIIGLGAAVALLNFGIKSFLALGWVKALAGVGPAAASSAAGVTLLGTALNWVKLSLAALVTPMGLVSLAVVAVGAVVAITKLNKTTKDYVATAQKNKDQLDREISLTEKKKSMAISLMHTVEDSTKTEVQRSVALERLITLGVEVKGVIRDEAGAIKNLDQVMKDAAPAVKSYVAEMNKLAERRKAEKMLEDVEAYTKAEERFIDAISKQAGQKDKEITWDVSVNMASGGMESYFEDMTKEVKESEDQLNSAEQKIREVISSWSGLDKASYKALLKASGMTDELAEKTSENFDRLDSSFARMWLDQVSNLKGFAKLSEATIKDLLAILDKHNAVIANAPETQFKELQKAQAIKMRELNDSLPDLDKKGVVKDLQFYQDALKAVGTQAEDAAASNAVYIESVGKINGLDTKVIEDEKKAGTESVENLAKKSVEVTKDSVEKINEFWGLETEAKKIALDNGVRALEIASAQGIGIEQDTSNKILDIKAQQIRLELQQKQNYLAMLNTYQKDNVLEIKKTENDIAALSMDFANIRADKIRNIEEKKADERERAEKTRAFNHSMELIGIESTYWENSDLKEREASEAKVKYLNEEISILDAQIAEKSRLKQRHFDEDEQRRQLDLERTQEIEAQKTQAKINEKELQDQLASTKLDIITTRASETEDPMLEQEALRMKHAIERQEWEDHYANLLEDRTLYNQLMKQLAIKHQQETDALTRKQQSVEYAKKAEFFGELSGMMGEFYAISNEQAIGFFYAQKALAVAEILMNTHAGAAKAYGQFGPFGIPMAAIITALGYAKAGMVMGLTVAQGVKGFAEGGEITGYSPTSTSDNIPINATAGEFMQPVPTVDYYGKGVMEALRVRAIPREILSAYAKGSSRSGGSRLAEGGEVTNTPAPAQEKTENLQIVNVLDPGMFDQYMASHAGQKTLMNVLSRNPQVIKNIMKS